MISYIFPREELSSILHTATYAMTKEYFTFTMKISNPLQKSTNMLKQV